MKSQTKAELSQLLSSYLDGELDEVQVHAVETMLSQNPDAQKELEELSALKNLLASKRPLPPAYSFWTRFSAELERRKKEEENLLPFPRKYLPVVSIGVAVVVLVVGIVLFQQRATLVEYVSRQSERVQKAVEENVLKGTLMPLFTHIDKNQALQFAMFGTLPLDAKAETELRVNEDSARGYTIDVNKMGERKTPTVTVKEFVDEVKPSRVQLEIIDSLLDLGRAKLVGSVLVAEDKAMAVSPELSRLNRVMLSGIAATLEPDQRVRFEHFLRSRKAPYMLAGGRRGPETPERIYHSMRTPVGMSQFVVVSADTVLVSRLDIDLDSLRRHAGEMVEAQRDVAAHMNSLIRRMAEREMAVSQRYKMPAPRVRVSGDSESFSIQVSTGWEGMPSMPMEPWVRPRMSEQVGTGRRKPSSGFNVQFGGDDSSFFFNLDMDSLMVRMGKAGEGGGIEVFKGDPKMRNRVFQFDEQGFQQFLDSAFQGKKHKMSKLDSLMNEMDKRERMKREK
ncbi:MAG: hypothetical protein ABSE41_02055 [Bacteroidota bacterium]|jgi:nucleoid DNA-binding protein